MKKILILLAGAAVLVAGAVIAQPYYVPQVQSINTTDLFQDVPRGSPQASSIYASAQQLRNWFFSGNSQQSGAPTLTTSTTVCGGSTATISGNDYEGKVTEGSSASTSCVITFATAYTSVPVCIAQLDNVAGDTAFKLATTTTAMTVTQTSASSNVLNYICMAQAGG